MLITASLLSLRSVSSFILAAQQLRVCVCFHQIHCNLQMYVQTHITWYLFICVCACSGQGCSQRWDVYKMYAPWMYYFSSILKMVVSKSVLELLGTFLCCCDQKLVFLVIWVCRIIPWWVMLWMNIFSFSIFWVKSECKKKRRVTITTSIIFFLCGAQACVSRCTLDDVSQDRV